MRWPGPDVGRVAFPASDTRAVIFPGSAREMVAFPPAPMPVIPIDAAASGAGTATAVLVTTPVYPMDVVGAGTAGAAVTAVARISAAVAGEGSALAVFAELIEAPVSGVGTAGVVVKPSILLPSAVSGSGTASVAVKPVAKIVAAALCEGIAGVTAWPAATMTASVSSMGTPNAALTGKVPIAAGASGTGTAVAEVMEAPKASWFDDLNRASLGSDWGVYSPLPVISGSTKMQAGAASSGTPSIVCLPMYAQPLLSDKQSVKIKLAAPTGTLDTAGNAVVGAYLRATGTANSGTMVAFQAYGTKCDLLSRSGSTWTQRATATITSLAAGNEFEVTADGNVYTVLRNGVAIPGCSWTDSGGLMTVGSSNRRWGAFLMSAYVSFQVRYSMAIDEITGKDI